MLRCLAGLSFAILLVAAAAAFARPDDGPADRGPVVQGPLVRGTVLTWETPPEASEEDAEDDPEKDAAADPSGPASFDAPDEPYRVAGARVILAPLVGRWATGDLLLRGESLPPAAAETFTDEDGAFELRAPRRGMWRLRVEAPGFVPRETRLVPLVRDVELDPVVIRHDTGVELIVRDVRERPVAGAAVVVHREVEPPPSGSVLPEPWWQGAPELAFTGDDGRVRLRAHAGEVLGVQIVAPGFPQATLRLGRDRTDPGAAPPLVELPAGRERLLTAVDRRGERLADALVWLGGRAHPVGRTDENGEARVLLPRHAGLRLAVATEAGHAGSFRVSGLGADARVRVPLDDPRRVRGRVVDSLEQSGVGSALVWSWYSPGRATESDADGWFELAGVDPRGPLAAVREGYLPAVAEHGEDTREAPVLVLRPVGSLSGVVVDENGDPLSGVVVARSRSGIGLAASPVAETGDDGSFVVPELAAGAQIDFHFRRADRPTIHRRLAPLEAGEHRRGLVFEMSRGLAAFGRVVDVDEAPVAGAEVFLLPSLYGNRGPDSHEARFARTDSTGTWRIRGLAPDLYDLGVRTEGYAAARVPGLELGSEADGKGDRQTESAETDLGTVVLVPGVELHGRVETGRGEPLDGAEVHLAGGERPSFWVGSGSRTLEADRPMLEFGALQAVTGEDGEFVLRGLAEGSVVQLVATRPGYLQTRTGDVEVPADEPVKVVLSEAATLYGHVSDESGWPVEDSRVVLYSRGAGGTSRGGPVRTDEQGDFVLGGVPPGTARLEVSAPRRPVQHEPVDVLPPSRGPTRVDVVLSAPGGEIDGLLLGPEGEGVPGARVVLGGDGTHLPRSTKSDAEGRFRFEAVHPGIRDLLVSHPGYAERSTTVRVDGAAAVTLELERGFSLRGRVVDAAGRPLAGARVVSSPAQGARSALSSQTTYTRSRSGGAFLLEHLPAGTYRLKAELEGYLDAVVEPVEIHAPVDDFVLEMQPGAVVRGRVEGVDFDDLGSVRVRIWKTDLRPAGLDHEGRFEIGGVPPGTWEVTALHGSDGRDVSQTIRVEEGIDPAPVVLRFAEGFELRGRVLLDGRPAADRTVLLTSTERDENGRPLRRTSVRTRHDGRFAFHGVEPGTYRVALIGRGGSVAEQEVLVEHDADILFEPVLGRVEGRVTDPFGHPLGGVVVVLQGPAHLQTESGGDGRFELEDVPLGEWTVATFFRDAGREHGSVVVTEGASAKLELVVE